jgi:hypothetical protein
MDLENFLQKFHMKNPSATPDFMEAGILLEKECTSYQYLAQIIDRKNSHLAIVHKNMVKYNI